jgi:type I restriction enzyme S subunit
MDRVESHVSRLIGTVPASEVRSASVHFAPGDVLYGRLRPYLNKVLLADFTGLCSAEFIPMTSTAAVDPGFVRYRLLAADFVAFAGSLDAGDRPRVDFDQVGTFPVRVPPIAEQRRIVEALETHFTRLDAAVAMLERVRANLKRYRAAVLQAAVEGRLAPTDRSRWKWILVGGLGEVTGGLTKNPLRQRETNRLPYLRVANVYANELRLEEIEEIGVRPEELARVQLRPDDLLIVEGNGSLDQIGRVALWNGSIHPCVHQNHIIKVRFSTPILARWTLLWLLSPPGRARIQHAASSTSGLHTLSISKVRALPIPIPPDEHMSAIIETADRLLSECDHVEHALSTTVARQSTLRLAFAGRLAPQDPRDEPASVLLDRIRAERAAAAPAPKHKPTRTRR